MSTKIPEVIAVVTTPYHAEDPEPLKAQKGLELKLLTPSPPTSDFYGWWLCATSEGKKAYVSETFMTMADGVGTLTRDYDATELTIAEGERVKVLEEHNGWYWVQWGERLGWVPLKNVKLLDELPCWQTGRLTIRALGKASAQAVLDYHLRNREHLRATNPSLPRDFYTLQYHRQNGQKSVVEYAGDSAYRFIFSLTDEPNQVIGTVNYSQVFRGSFQACYLGYGIDHHHQGLGLATEALVATNSHMFKDQNLHRIMANYLPENAASARVLEKLGFCIEGTAKNYLWIAGQWRDHVLTSLTNDSWRIQSTSLESID